MARPDFQFVSDILSQAATSTSQQVRLQKGVATREQIIKSLSAGQQVDHYRMKWTAESVERVIQFVQGLCKEFDEAHPDDMASAADIMDILKGAVALLNMHAQAMSKKEG